MPVNIVSILHCMYAKYKYSQLILSLKFERCNFVITSLLRCSKDGMEDY